MLYRLGQKLLWLLGIVYETMCVALATFIIFIIVVVLTTNYEADRLIQIMQSEQPQHNDGVNIDNEEK